MSVWDALARTPQEAHAAGLRFLLQRQGADGLWADFHLAPGLSDEWVTGYVGDRIVEIPGTLEALWDAWSALTARCPDRGGSGWGYNIHVPQDADSTAWVLRLAQGLGCHTDPIAVDARESLTAFTHHNGEFGTYGPIEDIATFIGATPDRDFRGWTAPHACVTAAACGLDELVEPEVLLQMQLLDGRWRSYWWASDTFATCLAVEALAGHRGTESALARAGEWAVRALGSAELTAFETANLLLVGVVTGHRNERSVREAMRHLTFTMLADGSWAPGALLRVPHPQDSDPDAVIDWIPGGRIEGAVVEDLRRVFTTATVVHALDVALREGMGA